MKDSPPPEFGCVVIGRNEGERLRRCLELLRPISSRVVYVDSGSRDRSIELAHSMGIETVELDVALPFTAARARNAGLKRLRTLVPGVDLVQFIDGDCEVAAGWLEKASAALRANEGLAAVFGRVRERCPETSIYNLLLDIELDVAADESPVCGGNAMFRIAALEQVAGFNPSLIAGEEPELCLRLRRLAWSIRQLDVRMAFHDAGELDLALWWRRCVRSGHAYAEGELLHRGEGEHYYRRESLRIPVYGVVIPTFALGLASLTMGGSILLFAVYMLSGARAYRATRVRGRARSHSLAYAAFCTLSKFAELQGWLRFQVGRVRKLVR